jgi:hypothetical protein
MRSQNRRGKGCQLDQMLSHVVGHPSTLISWASPTLESLDVWESDAAWQTPKTLRRLERKMFFSDPLVTWHSYGMAHRNRWLKWWFTHKKWWFSMGTFKYAEGMFLRPGSEFTLPGFRHHGSFITGWFGGSPMWSEPPLSKLPKETASPTRSYPSAGHPLQVMLAAPAHWRHHHVRPRKCGWSHPRLQPGKIWGSKHVVYVMIWYKFEYKYLQVIIYNCQGFMNEPLG